MKKSIKILSVAGAIAVLTASMPICSSAVEDQKVRVIVENGTLSKDSGANWDGILFDSTVEVGEGDSALSAFSKAVEENGFTQQGAETGFVSGINGLGGEQGGAWMATLNDWFTDEGLTAYTVENGKLSDGDEVHFMYTMNWGADLGYDWMSTDTTLADIQFSSGKLIPEFSPEVTEYTLELSEDKITVIPTASSKSFPVKMYYNEYTTDEMGTDFKKNTEIAVADGDVIIIGVANSGWMSYVPDGVTETVYKIGINCKSEEISNEPSQEPSSEPVEDKITIEALREKYPVQQAIYGNEWSMITLAKFDLLTDEIKDSYTKSVKEYLDSIGTAKISGTRSTSVSGVAIAVSGMEKNIYDFYGYNLLEPLSDMDYVTNQGINGAIYALMAFDTNAEYYIPKAKDGITQTTREKLISEILKAQGEDGGWTFDVGNKSDADMTGMALQALASYKDKDEVKPCIEKALAFLSESQKDNGGYVSYGAEDSESCSQVIAGLTMLDIDVLTDSRFIKNGNTVYDALMRYYKEDGTFAHAVNGDGNAISTSQAYYAVAVMYEHEYKNDMANKVVFEEPEVSTSSEPSKESSIEPSKESSVEPSKESSVEPSKTVSQTSSNVDSTDNIPTGDSENIILIFGLMLVSVSVIFAVSKKRV